MSFQNYYFIEKIEEIDVIQIESEIPAFLDKFYCLNIQKNDTV